MRVDCPRCNHSEIRVVKRKSFLLCRGCGYEAHWRQFFPGTKERKIVKKLFDEGKIEGDPLLGSAEKPLEKRRK